MRQSGREVVRERGTAKGNDLLFFLSRSLTREPSERRERLENEYPEGAAEVQYQGKEREAARECGRAIMLDESL